MLRLLRLLCVCVFCALAPRASHPRCCHLPPHSALPPRQEYVNARFAAVARNLLVFRRHLEEQAHEEAERRRKKKAEARGAAAEGCGAGAACCWAVIGMEDPVAAPALLLRLSLQAAADRPPAALPHPPLPAGPSTQQGKRKQPPPPADGGAGWRKKRSMPQPVRAPAE